MRASVNKKKKNNKIVILASVSFCLLVLILASVYFIDQTSLQGEQPEQVSELKDEKIKEGVTEEIRDNDKVDSSETSKEGKPSSSTAEDADSQKLQSPSNTAKPSETATDSGYIEGQLLPSEPTYIDDVLIVNKKYPLPQSFSPGEDVEARSAFELMAADARKEGFELAAFSTYRSFEYQQTLYNNYVERDGKGTADRYSARPGYSEHQTGLAFDIGEVGREDLWLTSEFGETEAGKWLAANAHKYGFILRYPEGKEKITGYMYESWHFRYLGVTVATEVKKSGLTLEEHLGID